VHCYGTPPAVADCFVRPGVGSPSISEEPSGQFYLGSLKFIESALASLPYRTENGEIPRMQSPPAKPPANYGTACPERHDATHGITCPLVYPPLSDNARSDFKAL